MNRTIDKANELLKAGKHAQAAKEFAAVLERERGNGDALFGLAAACRSLGKMAEAAEVYSRAASLLPSSFAAHFNAGLAYYSIGDFARGAGQDSREPG